MKRRNPLSFLLALALPFAAVAVTAPAFAQSAPPAASARPATTPVKIDGRLQRFVLSPRGDVRALVLQDGTVVHLSRHAGKDAVGALKAFDPVHVEGGAVKTPTGTVIMRPVVSKNGSIVVDASKAREGGKHGKHGRGEHARREKGDRAALAPITASGRVQALISTPRGHVHTVLLDDGTSASGFGLDTVGLKVGDRVTVNGKGGSYTQGKAMKIESITLPSGEVRQLPKHPKHVKHRGDKQAPV